jgi:small subunit ribosomal protein S8
MNIIANLSNCINNGQRRYKHFVKCCISKLTIDVITLLFQENIIRGFFFEKTTKNHFVVVLLKYKSNKKCFNKVSFITIKVASFKKHNGIQKYRNGLGLYIISTSKGMMTNHTTSKLKLGGILLMSIS